jgi:hypothetical protein
MTAPFSSRSVVNGTVDAHTCVKGFAYTKRFAHSPVDNLLAGRPLACDGLSPTALLNAD